MARDIETDICVIGAGAAGLSVAAGAALLGQRTVLIEKHQMGGDCLNVGCVPSKALLAAAQAAENVRRAPVFGIAASGPEVDFAKVRDHVKKTIAAIAPTDSQERFEGMGVQVIRAHGRFVAPDRVEAGDFSIRARRFVIAAGSRPALPPIPGLAQIPFFTNETIFDLEVLPRHLLVLGGGPIGVELAQAFRRLGSEVTILEAASLLSRDDPELTDFLRRRLIREGVRLREGVAVRGAERREDEILLDLGAETVTGSHLLVAAGRVAAVEGLGLDAAGIRHSAKGIETDAGLKTSNGKVYAIGDIAGGMQFTHVAGAQAALVIKNALFRLPAKFDPDRVPRVTYGDPELAQVGPGEEEARRRFGKIRILRWSLTENDRAKAEGDEEGMIKVLVGPRGRIISAGIVSAKADEMILPWVLAVTKGLKIGDMAETIFPYPIRGEVSKRAASSYFSGTLFSERTKALVRFLAKFG